MRSLCVGKETPLYQVTISDEEGSEGSFSVRQNLYDYTQSAHDSQEPWTNGQALLFQALDRARDCAGRPYACVPNDCDLHTGDSRLSSFSDRTERVKLCT